MSMLRGLRLFKADERGGVAVMFGVMVFVMLLAGGGALDFGIAQSRRAALQAASDAAALAAARDPDMTTPERKAAGEAIFNSNFAQHDKATFDLQVNPNDRVNVTATYAHGNYFLALIGEKKIDINVVAEVPIAKKGFAEVVLVLDYSDSMLDQNKYVRMREAAEQLIDTITDDGDNKNVKFGLVPFSAVVHADIPAAYIRSDLTFDGCTMDRRYPYNTEEGAIDDGNASKWGDHSVGNHPCADVMAANLKLLPLSDDLDMVKTTLNSYQPYLWTHIAAGAEFGWQTISPDGVFGGARPYEDKHNVKVVIILTDGMQTAPGWGVGDSRTVGDAEANLSSICTSMKAKGINVYTIGYDLHDSHTHNLLGSCASSGGYFSATDIQNGLVDTFKKIATKIAHAMLRLSK